MGKKDTSLQKQECAGTKTCLLNPKLPLCTVFRHIALLPTQCGRLLLMLLCG